jgi:hypothetical protein
MKKTWAEKLEDKKNFPADGADGPGRRGPQELAILIFRKFSGREAIMKKRSFSERGARVLAVGLLACFGTFQASFASLWGVSVAQDDTKSRILKATNTLIGPPDPSMTREKITIVLLELLDLAAAITPDNQYRQEIRSRIDVAKDLIKKNSIFNDKAHQYLSFAYRMMTNGKKFEPPKELEEFVTPAELQEKTQKYMKGLVAKTLQSLEAGDAGETARLLLEMVLMTLTPATG